MKWKKPCLLRHYCTVAHCVRPMSGSLFKALSSEAWDQDMFMQQGCRKAKGQLNYLRLCPSWSLCYSNITKIWLFIFCTKDFYQLRRHVEGTSLLHFSVPPPPVSFLLFKVLMTTSMFQRSRPFWRWPSTFEKDGETKRSWKVLSTVLAHGRGSTWGCEGVHWSPAITPSVKGDSLQVPSQVLKEVQ